MRRDTSWLHRRRVLLLWGIYEIDEKTLKIVQENEDKLFSVPRKIRVYHKDVDELQCSRSKREIIQIVNRSIIRGNIEAAAVRLAYIEDMVEDMIAQAEAIEAHPISIQEFSSRLPTVISFISKVSGYLKVLQDIEAKENNSLSKLKAQVIDSLNARPSLNAQVEEQNHFSVSSAARLWGIDRGKIYRKIEKNEMPAILRNGCRHVSVYDMQLCFGEPVSQTY